MIWPQQEQMNNAKKDPNYITPWGHQKLVDELNQLVLQERPEITKIIQWAAGNGDRSENADYLYGRKRLREIDKRANFLRKRIENAIIVNPEMANFKTVKFGATVTVLTQDNEEKIYAIVGVDEVNPALGLISFKSPIGSRLLNKEIGDLIVVKSPQKTQELEIINIQYKSISLS